MNCILWLIENFPVKFEYLTLPDQSVFCNSVGDSNLNFIISKLTSVTKVVLSNCELTSIPDIKQLAQLEVLDLRG